MEAVPSAWEEGAGCPVCGRFPSGLTTPPPPLTIIDSIGLICSGVLRGAYDPPPSARDLAEMILSEIPSFSGRG